MAATEIASAYIALYSRMPGVKDDITKALGGAGVQGAVKKSGGAMGSKLMDGMNSIGKVGAIALGGTIAAGVGGALIKGFQRLDALDQAKAKLTGLGHSAKTVDQIMNNALGAVKGTAFGMGAAATTAAGAVAAGIKPGADLERTLKAVADASTIAGTDMGSMGAIFNKVAASNKVQMDVINQLQDAGVPALALLADQMGVTAEEASDMASRGEIDFATFQSAMESGMGGAALESGNTFSGAMANVGASLGRIGANLLSGIFPDMKDGLGGLMEAMEPLAGVAKDVGVAIGGFVGFIKDNISWLGPLATGIGIAVGALIALNVIMWILSINPITLLIFAIVLAVGLLIGAIILLVQNWDTVVAFLIDVWAGFVGWFTGVMDGLLGWWGGVWDGFLGFISDIWNGIVGFVTAYINTVLLIIRTVIGVISSVWNSVWSGISSFFAGIWVGIIGAIRTVQGVFGTVFNAIGDIIRGAFNGVVSVVRGVINSIIDAVNGVIGGINGVAGALGDAIGINIRIGTIPRLADGALVGSSRGGSIVNVGEGRYDEAVLPLGGPQLAKIQAALQGRGGSGTPTQIKQYITTQDTDPRLFGRQMGREFQREMAG